MSAIYYYAIYALRRFFRSDGLGSPKDWYATTMLAWVEMQLVVGVVWILRPSLFAHVSVLGGSLIVAIPTVAINRYLLSDHQRWNRYLKIFSKMPSATRWCADVAVAFVVVAAIYSPLILTSIRDN
jgi:hypothetical protein